MKKYIYIRLLINLCLLTPHILDAQTNYFDSLTTEMEALPVEQKLDLILNVPFDKMTADFYRAEKLYNKGLELSNQISEPEKQAEIHNKISIAFYYQGNYDEALNHNLKALSFFEKAKNYTKSGVTYTNIGYQMKRRNLPKAFEFMSKGIALLESIEDTTDDKLSILKELSPAYNNYGVLFEMNNDIDSALYFYNKGLTLVVYLKDSIGIPYSLDNVAGAYAIKGDYVLAKKFFDKAFNIRLKRNDVNGLIDNYSSFGDLAIKQKKYKEAIENYLIALEKANAIRYTYMSQYVTTQLSFCYEEINDLSNALKYQKLSYGLKDRLLNESTSNKIAQLEIRYDTDKKEKEIKLLNTENKLKIKEANDKIFQRNLSLLGLGLFLFLAIFIYYQLLSKKKVNKLLEVKNLEITNQKQSLEEKNIEILSSINYAKRIQTAILPTKKIVKEYLKNSFILYKPKDIVAGDFYWMESVHEKGNKNNSTILFAAADCTGHGVPGAMVSVVCNNALNRSVREYGLTDPGEILDKTREIVIQEFEKSEEEVKDGMDIALCSLEGNTLKYAGAHNPLWIIRNGEILETKANKQPIGKFENLEVYTTHTFELQKQDTIYIFSDGFVDQFGGEKGKKFKAKEFRKLLLRVNKNTMEEQVVLINDAFENWKGDLEQIDDVCVIGVKI